MSDSAHESLLDAVVARIAGLNLDGLEANVQWKLAINETWHANLTFPAVVVSPVGTEAPLQSGYLVGFDHTALPVTVRLLERDAIDSTTKEKALLKWRQTIRRALRNQRLVSAEGCWLLVYQSSPTVEDLPPMYKMTSLPLVYQAKVEEVRDTP